RRPGLDDQVCERGRGLAELPPPLHPRLDVGHVSSIDQRDAGDTVHYDHAVGLVEQLQTLPVAALALGSGDKLVEGRRGEPTLVRSAVGLEQQAEEVFGIRVAWEPSCDAKVGRVRPAAPV